MKKVILMFTIVFAIVLTSCKNDHKHGADTHEHETENTEEHKSHDSEKGDMAMADKYQCPMDCEKGKTFDKDGKCSVCEMDLKKVEHKEGEDHDNDESHEKGHNNDEHSH